MCFVLNICWKKLLSVFLIPCFESVFSSSRFSALELFLFCFSWFSALKVLFCFSWFSALNVISVFPDPMLFQCVFPIFFFNVFCFFFLIPCLICALCFSCFYVFKFFLVFLILCVFFCFSASKVFFVFPDFKSCMCFFYLILNQGWASVLFRSL